MHAAIAWIVGGGAAGMAAMSLLRGDSRRVVLGWTAVSAITIGAAVYLFLSVPIGD